MPEQFDVIVVGGAPAGLTAALYLGRQWLKTLVITKDIGGQALLTDTITNSESSLKVDGSLRRNFRATSGIAQLL